MTYTVQSTLAAQQPTGQSEWVSVLVLTRNEALHIERCIRSAKNLSSHIFVVDSLSSDGTDVLAKKLDANVISASFDTFSEKLNWSFDNICFPTPWVIRLDSDEVFSDELLAHLRVAVERLDADMHGIYLRRQLWFMGRWIRYGGMYPTYSMRLWRPGSIRCERRELDEHMILRSGVSTLLDFDIIDNPLFSLSKWIDKHNIYSTLEARSASKLSSTGGDSFEPIFNGSWAERRRWLKVNVFYRFPPFIRPTLYFFYRYFVQRGFLDGRIGFIFHFMHGLWYRCLVDAKILELTLACRENDSPENDV